jgi:hypothetical protein
MLHVFYLLHITYHARSIIYAPTYPHNHVCMWHIFPLIPRNSLTMQTTASRRRLTCMPPLSPTLKHRRACCIGQTENRPGLPLISEALGSRYTCPIYIYIYILFIFLYHFSFFLFSNPNFNLGFNPTSSNYYLIIIILIILFNAQT